TAAIEWTFLQVLDLIFCEDQTIERWIKSVCDTEPIDCATGQELIDKVIFSTDWRAPQWLCMRPNGSEPYNLSTAWNRMNRSETRRVLTFLREGRWTQRLESTLEDVAGSAHETLAMQKSFSTTTRDASV